MSMTRPPYASEFREQMVALVRSGRSPEELAREFEPSAQSIGNWLGQADRDEGRSHDGLTSTERAELRRLRRENRRHPGQETLHFGLGAFGIPSPNRFEEEQLRS